MNWLSLIVGLLKVAEWLLDYATQQKWIKVGADAEVARAAARVFQKTEYAKKIAEQVDAMPDAEVDDLLTRLEPDDGVRKPSGLSAKI